MVAIAPSLIRVILFVPVGVAIAVVDWREFRIPDVLVAVGLGMFLLYRIVALREPPWIPLLEGTCAAGLLLLVRTVTGGKLGLGDVKLSGLIAVAVGAVLWFVSVAIGCVAALVWVGLRHGSSARDVRIPFGTFLVGGAIVALLATALSSAIGGP